MKLTADAVNRMAGEKIRDFPGKKGPAVFFAGKTGFYLWREKDVICAKRVRGFGRTQRFCTNAAGAAERPAPKSKKRILCAVLLLIAAFAALLFAGGFFLESCTVGAIGGADGPTQIYIAAAPLSGVSHFSGIWAAAAVIAVIAAFLFFRRKKP